MTNHSDLSVMVSLTLSSKGSRHVVEALHAIRTNFETLPKSAKLEQGS